MAEDFAHKAVNIAVARTCLALEFNQSYSNVIDSLSDVVKKYIQNLSEIAHDIAESAGRSQPGIQEIINALEQSAVRYLPKWI